MEIILFLVFQEKYAYLTINFFLEIFLYFQKLKICLVYIIFLEMYVILLIFKLMNLLCIPTQQGTRLDTVICK